MRRQNGEIEDGHVMISCRRAIYVVNTKGNYHWSNPSLRVSTSWNDPLPLLSKVPNRDLLLREIVLLLLFSHNS